MTIESNTEDNRRKSDNLMNIVAVVYGVAITIALSMRPNAILHAWTATEWIPSMALVAAVVLTAFSFYSYVLAISGYKPYDVDWSISSINSPKWYGLFRFTVDLALAVLYVHLLLTAVNIKAGPKAKPNLNAFVLAFALVFAWVVIVRWVRRGKPSGVALIAAILSLLLWLWIRSKSATHGTDLAIEFIIIIATLVYCGFYQWRAYKDWRKTLNPRILQLAIYRPTSSADKAGFNQLLDQKLDARRYRKAKATIIQAWRLPKDGSDLQGAALIFDAKDQATADRLASLPADEKELITIETIQLASTAN